MKSVGLLIAVFLASVAHAQIDYPIVYCEQDRPSPPAWGDTPEVSLPWITQHTRLMLRNSDGSTEVLFEPDANAAVMDPQVSLDAKTVHFALIHDCTRSGGQYPPRPLSGCDVYSVDLATKAVTRLTNQDEAPYAGRNRGGVGVFNMGPCEVAGGRIMFTSDREIVGQHQLYAMDLDGKNVEKVGYMNLQAALHPERLSNGRIMWSTAESQGIKRGIQWGIWHTYPDGRDFEPFYSAFVNANSSHFHTESASKEVITTDYYQVSNEGFGAFRAAPLAGGFEHRIGGPFPKYVGDNGYMSIFVRTGAYRLTPWTNIEDQASPTVDPTKPWNDVSAERVGKVTHPATTPSLTNILCTYSPGPVNVRNIPTNQPPMQTGIYLCPVGQPTAGPSDLIKVVDEPNKNEFQAKAVVPYAVMFGEDPPLIPWVPNNGSHPELRPGTPYALIGTSGVYNRETLAMMSNHGMAAQGGNSTEFDNSQIDAIRILTMEFPSYFKPTEYSLINNNEKLYILGDIPLRKFDAAGNPIMDEAGDPDTSFLAKMRADEPFTFQLLDKKGKSLTTSMTWHHLRPGEVKTNCRGCHAHTHPGIGFELSAASKPGYEITDLSKVKPKRLGFHQDVLPILEKYGCVQCHSDGTGPAITWHNGAMQSGKAFYVYQSLYSKMIQRMESTDPSERMPREGDTVTEAEIRTIAEWIDTGAMNYADSAIRDDTKPTLFIHSPRRETSPLTQVVVSAADAELDKASLKVTLNGAALSLTEDDHIWSATVPSTESGELVAEVKDEFGNLTRLVRTFGPETTPTPDPDPDPDPTDPCAELEARVAELEAELTVALADVASSAQQIQALEMQVQSLQSKINAAKAALEN